MELKIMKLRDKARATFHRLSHALGETEGVKPDSLADIYHANESLNLDLPSFSKLLPYESVDENGFFVNRNSIGFGLMLLPMPGADETLINSLASMFKNKLTYGTDCTFMMYKHPWLAGSLQNNFGPILERGGIYAELARMSIKYHLNAIHNGYKNNRNIPAALADYQCMIFISRKKSPGVEHELVQLRHDFESELKVASFCFSRCDAQDFQVFLRAVVSPNFNEFSWPEVHDSSDRLSDTIPRPSTVYKGGANAVNVSVSDDEGVLHKSRIVSCEVVSYPKNSFPLWQTPDLFANVLRQEQGIPCPFLLSFTIRGTSQEKMKARAKSRASSADANNNKVQSFINPGISDEANEWGFVHAQASKGDLHLMPTFYNLILFTDEKHERQHVAKAISCYRSLDFTLIRSPCIQWLRFLASLPFMLTEGLFSPMELLGKTKLLSHYNAANLAPVVADFKGSNQGLLLPTIRNQLFYLDIFDDRALPITNYNRLTVASTGSGKSFFEQAQILDGLSRGQQIYVIDLGGSYKHLCDLVGGTYINAKTLTLNPFTLFDFDGVTELEDETVNDYTQIRDLLAIMANPHEPISEVQRAWLLTAVLKSWEKEGRKTRMDDVLNALRDLLEHPDSKNDQRLKDLLILLDKYGSNGIYGHIFNSDTPLLNGSNFVVLELGDLQRDPELMSIVMFVMIVIIQGQFYNSDRKRQKRCIIDEAWRFLANGTNPICAAFIEQGFRTARKHMGGFSVITQFLKDTVRTVQGAAIAASADTKIIMRQGDFKRFIAEHPDYFSSLESTLIDSFGEAKVQGFSDVMLQFGSVSSFHRYFCDPFSRILFSTSGEEYSDIEALIKQGAPMAAAIKEVAYKYYGAELCA
ncbi:type IV secretion system protein TraC [Legionella saoudiensis]|uniref:type IV secretion system protein TraC n=1 Tax=Legionella saoudiensis TaxID=1750561 RepID=UPI0007307F4D|nr:type IV secretion system protein TraC [Legionella saoudiensis]